MKNLLFFLLLAGCNPFHTLRPTSEELVTSGNARREYKLCPRPLYCYKTLGHVMCYTKPCLESNDRISGYYGQHPFYPNIPECIEHEQLDEVMRIRKVLVFSGAGA